MSRLSFVQITDHHLTASEDQPWHGFATAFSVRAVLRHIAENVGNRIDFIVSTGDLADPASDAAYRNTLRLLAARVDNGLAPGPLYVSAEGLRDMPMYVIPGNHDDRDAFFRHLFPGEPPMPLMNAKFESEGVQFVCLDWGMDAEAITYPGTLRFLAATLQGDRPAVILTHHHLSPVGVAWLDGFIPEDVAQFWEIVAGRHVLGIFGGHVHMTHEAVVRGIPTHTLASTAFQFACQDRPLMVIEPPEYRLVTIEDGAMTTQTFKVPL